MQACRSNEKKITLCPYLDLLSHVCSLAPNPPPDFRQVSLDNTRIGIQQYRENDIFILHVSYFLLFPSSGLYLVTHVISLRALIGIRPQLFFPIYSFVKRTNMTIKYSNRTTIFCLKLLYLLDSIKISSEMDSCKNLSLSRLLISF